MGNSLIMLRTTLLFAACIMVVCSCKKKGSEDPNNPTDPVATPVYPNYTAMKPGNYWIYQQYKLDSATGNASAESKIDSCYVEKDTIINGKTYHKYMSVFFDGSGYVAKYFRDSLSYVVTESGRIVFSSDDFTHIFRTIPYTNPLAGVNDTISITERMYYKDRQLSVPAGQFKTSTFRQIYYFPTPKYNFGPYRSYDYIYA